MELVTVHAAWRNQPFPVHIPRLPLGITVIGDKIAVLPHFPVIQDIREPHHVAGGWLIRIFSNRFNFKLHEFDDGVGSESFPIQACAVDCSVPWFHVFPLAVSVSPKRRPICLVQIFQCLVSMFQPLNKIFSAVFAPAFTIVLVADMPTAQCRMVGITL